MPGYVIHLSVAEEYLRKHTNKKEKYSEFIEGVIYPDSVIDKSETHYGKTSSLSNVYEFLKENKIDNSFNRGYFLHLLTDYLFYNRYIDHTSKDIYNDYDILNKRLIENYNVKVPEKIKENAKFKDGKLVILTNGIVDKLINDISEMDIDEVAKDVMKNPNIWTKMRELKRY